MKKRTSLYYLILLISYTASSQQSFNNNLESEYISNKTINLKENSNDYTGSPYFNEVFIKGNIYKNGELLATNKSLRYNASKDEFEIKNSLNPTSDLVKTLFKKNSLSIKIGIKEFVFIRPNSTNTANGYFLLLQEGENISYLKKIKKKFIPGKKAYSSMAVNTQATYKSVDVYYLLNKEGTLFELPNSKNGIIETFGSHKKEIKAFLKENKLNIKKEKGLKKVVVYYNSL
ncbi:MAG: hypothetical protein ACJAX7_001936 [Saprospiraceae bacterium]|jgi:hypothetical protein